MLLRRSIANLRIMMNITLAAGKPTWSKLKMPPTKKPLQDKKTLEPEAKQPEPSGDWKQTIRKALAVQRPQGGFPKPQKGAGGPPPKALRRPRGRSR